MVQLTLQSLSNDIYIYFALEKEIEKIVYSFKKHAETLHSILTTLRSNFL